MPNSNLAGRSIGTSPGLVPFSMRSTKLAACHAAAECVTFRGDIVANRAKGKQIPVIADNLAALKIKPVEKWCVKFECDVVAHSVFTSMPDLTRNRMRYVGRPDHRPRRVKWNRFDPSRRITSISTTTAQ